ncbi:MAG: TonB-dependent receptor [Burkholderiales bacterium]
MKYFVTLGVATLATSMHCIAQSTADTIADEVVVTATRFPKENRDFPIGVTVISATDIARSTAQTLPQLLSLQAGVQIRDASGSPDQQVDMRGFGITGDQNTLVLLDGQRLSENELTTARWSAVPLDSIQRIEVLRGSGAVLYGGGATGGVINIITKSPKAGQVSGQGSVLAGSYGTYQVQGGASGGGENVAANVYASYYGSDNYRENNRVSQTNVQADLRWFDATSTLSLKAFGGEQNLDLPGALTAARIAANPRAASTPNDSSKLSGWGTILSGTERIGDGELALDATYRNRDASASILFLGNTFNTQTDVNVWTLSPRGRLPYSTFGVANTLVAGVDAAWWYYSQDRDFGPARLKANQTDFALYAQQTSQVTASTLLSYGARVQGVSRFAQDLASTAPYATGSATGTPVAWEVALRQRLAQGLAAFGKYGRSFRVPNVDELFNQFGGPNFDPVVNNLAIQTSMGGEIGLEYADPRYSLRTTFYGMDLNNEISFNPVTFSNVNLPPTRRYGVEVQGRWLPMDTLDLSVNYTYAVSEFRSGEIGGDSLAGKTVPLVSRNKANAQVLWRFVPSARFLGTVSYVGEQFFDGDATNTFGQKIPAYTLVNLKAEYDIDGWTLAAGVNNLLNEKYFNYGLVVGPTYVGYPQANLTLFTSARYVFR